MSDVQTRDPDDMSDEEFAAYQAEAAQSDAPLEDEAPQKEAKQPEPQAQDPEDLDDDELDRAADAERQENVPHGRFHRERERRKQAETRYSDLEARYQRLEQRTNDIMQMRQAAQQPEQQREPTFQERAEALRASGDFVGLIDLQLEQIRSFQDNQAQQQEQTQRQRGLMELANRVANDSRTDLERAIQRDPHVADAYHYMREQGYKQLTQVEGLSPDQALQQLNRYELETFHGVLSRGGSPADYAMRWATAHGFQPKAPEAPIEVQAEKMERKNDAQSRAKTLSGAGSEARTEMPSVSDIANMSDEDFAAYKAKYGDRAMMKAFGQA